MLEEIPANLPANMKQDANLSSAAWSFQNLSDDFHIDWNWEEIKYWERSWYFIYGTPFPRDSIF